MLWLCSVQVLRNAGGYADGLMDVELGQLKLLVTKADVDRVR
eukprot:SAG31_NODE_27707_length_421_cov_1.114907_1_plen_42_part_00